MESRPVFMVRNSSAVIDWTTCLPSTQPDCKIDEETVDLSSPITIRACVRDQRNNLPEKICSALASVRTTRRQPASWKEFGKASANSTPNSCSERQITRHLWAESAVPTKCSVNSFGTVLVSTPPSFAPHLKRLLTTQSRRGNCAGRGPLYPKVLSVLVQHDKFPPKLIHNNLR
jgi:hypothetical protein